MLKRKIYIIYEHRKKNKQNNYNFLSLRKLEASNYHFRHFSSPSACKQMITRPLPALSTREFKWTSVIAIHLDRSSFFVACSMARVSLSLSNHPTAPYCTRIAHNLLLINLKGMRRQGGQGVCAGPRGESYRLVGRNVTKTVVMMI